MIKIVTDLSPLIWCPTVSDYSLFWGLLRRTAILRSLLTGLAGGRSSSGAPGFPCCLLRWNDWNLLTPAEPSGSLVWGEGLLNTSSSWGWLAGWSAGGNVGAAAGPLLRAANYNIIECEEVSDIVATLLAWKNSGAFSGRLRCWTALPDPEPPGIVSS